MPSGPEAPTRPHPVRHPSHRQQSQHRGRLAVGAGVAAALAGLGVAVAVGAVPTPLTSGSSAPLDAATLAKVPASSASDSLLQASASPFGFATAKMPAGLLPSHNPSPKPTPSKTTATASATPTQQSTTEAPTMVPSSQPATQSAGLTPQPTAEYQTPSGQNQLAWSEAILTALGDPLTSANIISIGYWMQNEAGSPPYGIVGANNPINVSEPGYGGTQIQYEAPGYYLMSYPTVQDGVEAIAAYLNSGSYPDILNDLKQGDGLGDPSLASELSEYSGGGYSTIPDSWGQSQGQPES
jgi:hypothetical protein